MEGLVNLYLYSDHGETVVLGYFTSKTLDWSGWNDGREMLSSRLFHVGEIGRVMVPAAIGGGDEGSGKWFGRERGLRCCVVLVWLLKRDSDLIRRG